MVNSDKLKGRMREMRITQATVAKTLNIAQPTVTQKLNNVRSFSLEEAEKLSVLLGISDSEFPIYFFAQ